MVEWVKVGDGEDPNTVANASAAAVAQTYTLTSVVPEATAAQAQAEASKAQTVTGEPVVAPPVVTPPPAPKKNSWLKNNILYLVGMVGLAAYIVYIAYGMYTKMEPVTVTADPLSFSQILEVKPYYLRAQRRDGQIQVNTQGSAAWRYSNPSKLVQGDFTRSMGSLGSDGKLALFPDYKTGRKAAEVALFEDPTLGFSNSTIENAIARWALRSDHYNPAKYAKDVADAAGVDITTPMNKLTEDQRQKFIDQVQKEEGWKIGTITVFKDEEDFKKHGF